MLSGEATNTNFIAFGLTRPRLKHTIYCTWGEHATHYVTDAVFYHHFILLVQMVYLNLSFNFWSKFVFMIQFKINFDLWPWKSIGFQILLRTKYVPSSVKIHWRMLILECSQRCYRVKIRPCDLDLWHWKSIGFQIHLRTKCVLGLVKIHWRMLILECSQGCCVVKDLTQWPRINILQWILTKLGTYLVLKRIWNPIDFQGHRSKAYMWTFWREHFPPDFEGPSRQLSKSSTREKNKVQKILTYILRSIFLEIPHLELPRWRKTPKDTNGKGECHI